MLVKCNLRNIWLWKKTYKTRYIS